MALDFNGNSLVSKGTLDAGERLPDNASASYIASKMEANWAIVDATGGAVTDEDVSGGLPAHLLGIYCETGTSETITLKNGTTTLLAETMSAGGNLNGVLPQGVAVKLTKSLVVSATLGAKIHVFWSLL